MLYYNQKEKEKEITKMLINIWKSTLTNTVYEMPADWLPKFDGWQLIGTYWKN